MAAGVFSRRRFCVAPMLDWTDTHCRVFHRSLTRHARLYTEMVAPGAVIHAGPERFLAFDPCEHPVACQLGGSDPAELAAAAAQAARFGYDEINFNCGCPSPRVQKGSFGACLMADPELAARCWQAMAEAAGGVEVTVKHRIGIGRDPGYGMVRDFVGTLFEAGCRSFIVHARTAILAGISPRDNRKIPPLRRDVALRLKKDFPGAEFCINGGISSVGEAIRLLDEFDGVMVGRAAYRDPWLLAGVDEAVFGCPGAPESREEAVSKLIPAMAGLPSREVWARARHMLGLFNGRPGAKLWRRTLSEAMASGTLTSCLLAEALAAAASAVRREGPTV